MKDEIYKELKELSPWLSEKLRNDGFHIDSHYFETLNTNISNNLGLEKDESLKSNYFETLQNQIINKVIPKKVNNVFHLKRWVVAASFVIIAACMGWFLINQEDKTYASNEHIDEDEIIEYYEDDLSISDLASLMSDQDLEEDFLTTDIYQDDIDEVLDYMIDDDNINLIY